MKKTELLSKYVAICYRSVIRHPFLISTVIFVFSMYRMFPLLFSFLVSVSPVVVTTAVLLGTLLSYGHPNLPDIEIDSRKDREFELDESRKMESKVSESRTEVVEGPVVDLVNERERAFEVEGSGSEKLYVVEEEEGDEEEEDEDEEDKGRFVDEKVVLGSHYSPLQQSESSDRLWEGSVDPVNSDRNLLWKRVEGDDEDEDEDEDEDDEDGSDSGSDGAESSSPDASMADIIPMLDELHPLLSEEQESREVPYLSPRDGSVAGLEHSLESSDSSSESNDDDDDDDDEGGVENREGLEVGNDDEDKESKHIDKLDEIQSAIKWTEYDQKNLMNLGTSEMERNRRLENLIARRRARKTMRMQAENNLIDLESTDLPWNIPPISTARNNPFDYDSNDNIPGSAPSVFTQRRNPFDLPYDSSEEKPDLVGDTFQQEFAVVQPKEPFFRRHESFNVGPSGFGATRSVRQESRLKPYFVPERSFADFQRQFSGLSDSKASSVPDTESVSSVGDLENKDQIDDEQSLIVELGSEKDHEHDSESEHEHVADHVRRPYFVPEQVASDETSFSTFQRQLSEVSDSKASSVLDTESGSSDDDHEHKDHVEDEHSLEAKLVSEKDDEPEPEIQEHLELTSEDEQPLFQIEHVSDHATHGSDTIEDDSIVDLIQVPRGDVAEIIVGNAANEQEVANAEPTMDLMSDEIHMNLGDQELRGNVSSSSSLCEVSDQIYNDNEVDDEVDTSVAETTYYFVDRVDSMERSEVGVTSLLVEESHPREPVYDSSPRSVSRNLSSSSILNDLQAEIPVGEDHPHRDESVQQTEDQHQPTSSVADSGPETMDAQNQLPAVDYEEPLIDMDASHEPEHVQVSAFISQERSNEGVHQEEVVSQFEEVESLFGGSLDKPLAADSQKLQGHEFGEVQVASSSSEAQFNEVIHIETHETPSEEEAISQAQEEFPLLDTSVNEPSEENPEVLQEQITDSNTENFQIKETENDVSLNMNSVSRAEPDVVEVGDETKEPGSPAYATDTHSIDSNNVPEDIDDLDEVHEIDETLLVELDAVGDFSVNDLGSSSNDMKEDPRALGYDFETNQIADVDSYSNDLGSVSNETKPDPHASEHDHETTHSVDEDSYSKEVGSTLYEETRGLEHHDIETKSSGEQESADFKDLDSTLDEVKPDPSGSDHDLETQHSGNNDSYSKDLDSTLNDIKQDPQTFDHDLETECPGDEDFYSKDVVSTSDEMKQDPHTFDHDLETERPGDEDFYSKDVVSTSDEMKQDPHTSEYDLETKRSIDEDSYTKDLESTFSEMRRDPQALEHRLETFYSVDDNFYSKHLESTLNEMKQVEHALEHDLKTNGSSDAEVTESQNDKKTSNTEVEGASEAEASNRELINDADEAVLPLETESSTPLAGSGSATVAHHGTEKAASTSNTDKE